MTDSERGIEREWMEWQMGEIRVLGGTEMIAGVVIRIMQIIMISIFRTAYINAHCTYHDNLDIHLINVFETQGGGVETLALLYVSREVW